MHYAIQTLFIIVSPRYGTTVPVACKPRLSTLCNHLVVSSMDHYSSVVPVAPLQTLTMIIASQQKTVTLHPLPWHISQFGLSCVLYAPLDFPISQWFWGWIMYEVLSTDIEVCQAPQIFFIILHTTSLNYIVWRNRLPLEYLISSIVQTTHHPLLSSQLLRSPSHTSALIQSIPSILHWPINMIYCDATHHRASCQRGGVSGQALSRTAHSDVTIMRVPMRVTATTHYLIDDHSTLQ